MKMKDVCINLKDYLLINNKINSGCYHIGCYHMEKIALTFLFFFSPEEAL